MNIARSINLGMAYKGIKNQKALANLTGIGEATISNIISKKSDPSVGIVEKIATKLGYSVSEFVRLGEDK